MFDREVTVDFLHLSFFCMCIAEDHIPANTAKGVIDGPIDRVRAACYHNVHPVMVPSPCLTHMGVSQVIGVP